MILKEFGFVAFFAGVKASSFCTHLRHKLIFKIVFLNTLYIAEVT
jgi:hypothetical protein